MNARTRKINRGLPRLAWNYSALSPVCCHALSLRRFAFFVAIPFRNSGSAERRAARFVAEEYGGASFVPQRTPEVFPFHPTGVPNLPLKPKVRGHLCPLANFAGAAEPPSLRSHDSRLTHPSTTPVAPPGRRAGRAWTCCGGPRCGCASRCCSPQSPGCSDRRGPAHT